MPAPRLTLAIVLLGLPFFAQAQHSLAEALPDSPSFLQQSLGTAAISGTVLDVTETTIPGATVVLTGAAGVSVTVLSDSNGLFTIPNLPAGTFTVIISSPGLESLEFANLHLLPGEQRVLPRIAMPLAATSTTVSVVATPDEIATEQVRAEEKQRVLGIFPNFYSSYIWDAAPLKPKHKFSLATHSLIDPVAFITSGIVAGIEQVHNTFPGYGDDAASFGKRYGAVLADHVTSRYLSGAVFPSLFHQDPRYFYMGTGTVPHRALYAISSTVICRGDNGHRQLNYSRILGSLAAAAISNFYREPSDRTLGLTFRNTLIGLGASSATNLIREFVFRKYVSHVPDYANGKAAEHKS